MLRFNYVLSGNKDDRVDQLSEFMLTYFLWTGMGLIILAVIIFILIQFYYGLLGVVVFILYIFLDIWSERLIVHCDHITR